MLNKDKLIEQDLGFVDDAITIIIDLTHIEIHSWKSWNQTKDKDWLNINKRARIERTNLLELICDDKLLNTDGELWCFQPDTKIITIEGIKDISDIKNGNLVLTHKNRWRKVINTISRNYEGEIISINTKYSNIPINVTPNHLFYVAENVRKNNKCWKKGIHNFNFVWKEANKLKNSDFLYLPIYKNNNNNNIKNINLEFYGNYANQFGTSNKNYKQKLSLNIDDKFMRMIGLYISEGHHSKNITKSKGKIKKYENVGLSFGKKEKDYANFIINCFRKYFNYDIKYIERESTLEFNTGKRIICKFFSEFGDNASNKKIPKWIFGLTERQLSYLVKGLIDGDGNKGKYNFSYSTISESLAYDVRLILNKLGIICSIDKRIVKEGNINGRTIKSNFPVFTIRISGDSARKLSNLIEEKFDGGNRTNGSHTYINKDFILIPIKNICKKMYNGKVFNLSVEEDESYSTFNGVAHNCFNKHSLRVVGGYIELGNREITSGNLDEGIKYFKKASSWLGVFLIKNKINTREVKNESKISKTSSESSTKT